MPMGSIDGTCVAIVGSGFVGRAWAISFARAGATVKLWDRDAEAPAKAITYISGVLGQLENYDLLGGQSVSAVSSRIRSAATLEEALEDVVYVQENTPENLQTKIEIFKLLDTLARPDAILASSTSALLPSSFTKNLKGQGRCLVVHPINPPYLIPAVEIVPAPWTAAETVSRAKDLLIAAGHAPIVMQKELDGFIMNRLQGALLEECFRLVADGYASVEDVDIGIREGLALRWSFMGPFETADLNAPAGIRDYAERYQQIFVRIFPQMQRRVDWSGPVMDSIEMQRRQCLPAEDLQQRQVWRDVQLMALAAHKIRATKDVGK
jgi:L-gulonate 3-dehydrogenase